MGYPEGVKEYRIRDTVTGAFFTARDVEFDESLPSLTDTNSDDLDNEIPSTPSTTQKENSPVPLIEPNPMTLTLPAMSILPKTTLNPEAPCRSARIR